ncbi:MAG: PH domain-containing protein, partial [Propionibacteriaceae bacterium]|nr:PH domain-containing protein [Propionibacteriaceae bacterium]
MRARIRRISYIDPRIERYLIDAEGEALIEEIRKHPVTMVPPILIVLVGVAIILLSTITDIIQPALFVVGLIISFFGFRRVRAVPAKRFRHPGKVAAAMTILLSGLAILLLAVVFYDQWPVVIMIGFSVCMLGLWRFHTLSMDRFVVTNQRVFRVHGVFTRHLATVPLARILDITLKRTTWGLILNYGHFTFESAAKSVAVINGL